MLLINATIRAIRANEQRNERKQRLVIPNQAFKSTEPAVMYGLFHYPDYYYLFLLIP